MQERELELSVGDVVQIGNQLLVVVDIENEQVTFRIDDSEVVECVAPTGHSEFNGRPR